MDRKLQQQITIEQTSKKTMWKERAERERNSGKLCRFIHVEGVLSMDQGASYYHYNKRTMFTEN